MSKKRTDILSSLIIIAGCWLFWTQTLKFKARMPGDIGSGRFPQIVLACIALMCVVRIFLAFLNKDASYAETVRHEGSDYFRGFGTVLLLGIYVFTFKKIGFVLTTVAYLFLQLLLLSNSERRSGKYLLLYAAISLLLPGAVWILFVKVMHLMLPAGVLAKWLL